MSSIEENVAVLGSNHHHETEPAPTTTTSSTTTTAMTATTAAVSMTTESQHNENINAENQQTDVHPPSLSLDTGAAPVDAAAASKKTTIGEKGPQSDSIAHNENQQGTTLQNEHPSNLTEDSSTAAAAAAAASATVPTAAAPAPESTGEIPVATVIATPSGAASPSTQPTPENLETAGISAADGEASDKPQAVKEAVAAGGAAADEEEREGEETGPGLTITLLLITGARHPFKIDRKYLRRRSIKVENDDPFNMSVYTLKELIWREWRSEWEPQPPSPSAIRLISFGKLLDDKSPLSESSLTHDAPNVIHMTVKPQEALEEEDAKGGKSYSGRDREATDRSPGCRCTIL